MCMVSSTREAKFVEWAPKIFGPSHRSRPATRVTDIVFAGRGSPSDVVGMACEVV